MSLVTTKSSIHRVTVPTATAQDVVTAVGVNKYLNGINGQALNGILLAQFNSGVEPNQYTLGGGINPGPGPTLDMLETPAVGVNIGGTSSPFPASVARTIDAWGELPDGFTHVYAAVDVSWARPEGFCRLYMISEFGAIWMFAEITPDRSASNTIYTGTNSIGVNATETGTGRHLLQFEVPIAANLLPPIGKAERRKIQVAYAHARPTNDNTPPYAGTNQGVWTCNVYAIKK